MGIHDVYMLLHMRLSSRALALVAALFITSLARGSHADDVTPQEAISKDLHGYYAGERGSAYFVAALGAVAIGAGTALVTRDSDFARGLGWPLLTLGALEGIGAFIYAFQVGAEIRHYEASLDRDAAGYRREELAHIRGTSSRFVFYRLTELGLTLGGVAAASYGFAANADLWKGMGIGVVSLALPLLVLDTVNNARAGRYEDHVRAFEPNAAMADAQKHDRTAVVPAYAGATPFYISYGGRF